MILLDRGVSPVGVNGYLWRAIEKINALWESKGVMYTRVTSLGDARHGTYSYHYKGMAVDIGTKEHGAKAAQLVEEAHVLLRQAKIPFDILWEDKGKENEHLHIEIDPWLGATRYRET